MRLPIVLLPALFALGAAHSGASAQKANHAAQPLILQANDGEHLVRRAGPTGG